MKRGTARLFVSCVTRNYFKETITSLKSVFEQLGYEQVLVEDAICCGWPYNCLGDMDSIAAGHDEVRALMAQSGLDLMFTDTRCYNQYSNPRNNLTENDLSTTYSKPKMMDIPWGKYFQFRSIEVVLVSSCFQSDNLEKAFKDTEGLTLRKVDFGFCCGGCTAETADKEVYNENINLVLDNYLDEKQSIICVFDDDFCRSRFQKAIEERGEQAQFIELLHWADLITKYGFKKRISTL